ncbi:anther-specific protein BCP1-like [Medicago truncatula]|nr:anther-specific protein BCP1-like [Medicago truncatula]
MAHSRYVVILALVMLAMIGLAYAADAPAPIEDDGDEYLVGTRSGDPPSAGGIVAGPIGGPVPPGAFDSTAPAPNAASTVYFSTVAGTAATAAIAGFFYF